MKSTAAELVEIAIQAAETGNNASWHAADAYAELKELGWTQTRIAKECGTTQSTVSKFIACSKKYSLANNRPSFWEAYRTVDGKTTAERIISSESNEWYTPARYIEAARSVLGRIDLDPASCEAANKTVEAARFFSKKDDGISQPWSGRVWLNPPYGKHAGEFVRRLVLEHQAGDVESAIALVNSNCTDTEWFRPLWDFPLCFTDHRIGFENGDGRKTTGCTHGSVFAYMGDNVDEFTEAFSTFGVVVERREPAGPSMEAVTA